VLSGVGGVGGAFFCVVFVAVVLINFFSFFLVLFSQDNQYIEKHGYPAYKKQIPYVYSIGRSDANFEKNSVDTSSCGHF